jgi:hypothetical protein
MISVLTFGMSFGIGGGGGLPVRSSDFLSRAVLPVRENGSRLNSETLVGVAAIADFAGRGMESVVQSRPFEARASVPLTDGIEAAGTRVSGFVKAK